MEEFQIDITPVDSMEGYTEVEKPKKEIATERKVKSRVSTEDSTYSCLRKELVNVQYVPRERTGITDKDHPYYGGLADGATITMVLPMLRNGSYVDPLTTEEKNFLEDYMSLEPNALSIHRKNDNFWDNFSVEIGKQGEVLDLSDPMNYITYKVLLANRTLVAPSLEVLKNSPLETYRFVLVTDGEVSAATSAKVSTKSACWKEYSKIENNKDLLSSLYESITGITLDSNTKLEVYQEKVTDQIDRNPERFLNAAKDPLLQYRALIKKAVDNKVIERRGDYYYYNNNPLCAKNENPTITVAAQYLASAKNQEIRFSIEAKVK